LAQFGVKFGVKTERFFRFFTDFTGFFAFYVNNLPIFHFYGMEEVVGSIPTRSTIFSTTLQISRFSVW